MVTLTANGPQLSGRAGIASWGLFGTEKNSGFLALYNMSAILPGVGRPENIPVSSDDALAGVELPNRPLQARVPHVTAGNYIMKFSYALTPGPSGKGPKTYPLCASLDVKS
jgi:hypothetical protein